MTTVCMRDGKTVIIGDKVTRMAVTDRIVTFANDENALAVAKKKKLQYIVRVNDKWIRDSLSN